MAAASRRSRCCSRGRSRRRRRWRLWRSRRGWRSWLSRHTAVRPPPHLLLKPPHALQVLAGHAVPLVCQPPTWDAVPPLVSDHVGLWVACWPVVGGSLPPLHPARHPGAQARRLRSPIPVQLQAVDLKTATVSCCPPLSTPPTTGAWDGY
jgi:hypothetical protein